MTMTWWMWTAAAAFGLAALAVLAAYLFARLWARPARRPVDDRKVDGLPHRDVTFFSGGERIQGWLIPPESGDKPWPTVIASHGWSHNRARLLPIARALHRAGLAVLLFDARGHGNSGGKPPITLRHFVEDQLAALAFVRSRPELDASRIAILGHSFGAAAAILTGSVSRRLGAVVAISPFADPRAVTRRALVHFHLPVQPMLWLSSHIFRRWLGLPMDTYTPLSRVNRVEAPLLLIHGDADRMIPLAASQALANRANGASSLLSVDGASHASVLRDAAVHSRVSEFVRHQLDQPGRAVSPTSSAADDPLRRSLMSKGRFRPGGDRTQAAAAP